MKNIDKEIARIKELISEETLYGKKIDLIIETTLQKNLVKNLVKLYGKSNTNLDEINKLFKQGVFEKAGTSLNRSNWNTNIINEWGKLLPAPNYVDGLKLSKIQDVLKHNGDILDEIEKYITDINLNTTVSDKLKSGDKSVSSMWDEYVTYVTDMKNTIKHADKILDLDYKDIKKEAKEALIEMFGGKYEADQLDDILKKASSASAKLGKARKATGKKLLDLRKLVWGTEDTKIYGDILSPILYAIQNSAPLPIQPVKRIAKEPNIGMKVAKVIALLWWQGLIYGKIINFMKCGVIENLFNSDDPEIKSKFGEVGKEIAIDYSINNLDDIISSINSTLGKQAAYFLTGGWNKIVMGCNNQINPAIIDQLSKAVDEKGKRLFSDQELQNIQTLGNSYFKKTGAQDLFNKWKSQYSSEVKEHVKTELSSEEEEWK